MSSSSIPRANRTSLIAQCATIVIRFLAGARHLRRHRRIQPSSRFRFQEPIFRGESIGPIRATLSSQARLYDKNGCFSQTVTYFLEPTFRVRDRLNSASRYTTRPLSRLRSEFRGSNTWRIQFAVASICSSNIPHLSQNSAYRGPSISNIGTRPLITARSTAGQPHNRSFRRNKKFRDNKSLTAA